MAAVAVRIPEPPDPRDSVILRLVECELRAFISELRAEARDLRATNGKSNGKSNGKCGAVAAFGQGARVPQERHEP